jgi:hypothetical protein
MVVSKPSRQPFRPLQGERNPLLGRSVKPNTPLGEALIARALEVISETYAYCLDSFEDLPRHAWMTPAQGSAHAHG